MAEVEVFVGMGLAVLCIGLGIYGMIRDKRRKRAAMRDVAPTGPGAAPLPETDQGAACPRPTYGAARARTRRG